MTGAAITQRSAQQADLEFEIALLHRRVGPCAGDQLLPADHLARALCKGDQDVESAAAETNGLVTLEQQPLCR